MNTCPSQSWSKNSSQNAASITTRCSRSGLCFRRARERKDFAGLTVEHYPIESEVTRHDLQLTIWESSSVLKAAFTYNTDILDSQTVEHMAEQLLLLLATVLKQPDTNSNDLRNLLQQRYEAYMESIEQERQQSIRRKFLSARRKSLAPTSSN